MRLLTASLAMALLSSPIAAAEQCVFEHAGGSEISLSEAFPPVLTIRVPTGEREDCATETVEHGMLAHCPESGDIPYFFVESSPAPDAPPLLIFDYAAWFATCAERA